MHLRSSPLVASSSTRPSFQFGGIIAFIIAAAIPDYFGFVGVISASMLLNLTYTLPPFFALGYDIQRHAIRTANGEGFDPATGQIIRNETVVRRWTRGFFAGGSFQVAINVWHIIYFLASLSMCGLGMYASIQGELYFAKAEYQVLNSVIGMIDAFKNDQLNSFSCQSPLNLNA